jgi:hypothetical protein
MMMIIMFWRRYTFFSWTNWLQAITILSCFIFIFVSQPVLIFETLMFLCLWFFFFFAKKEEKIHLLIKMECYALRSYVYELCHGVRLEFWGDFLFFKKKQWNYFRKIMSISCIKLCKWLQFLFSSGKYDTQHQVAGADPWSGGNGGYYPPPPKKAKKKVSNYARVWFPSTCTRVISTRNWQFPPA